MSLSHMQLLNRQIGAGIRITREVRSLSQEQLSRISGIDLDDLRQIESGEQEASATALHLLARSLAVAVSAFFRSLEAPDAKDDKADSLAVQRAARARIGQEIGARLRLARKVSGLTQIEVAVLSGISEDRLGRCERGETEPSAGDLHALADTLRVPLQFFFKNLETAQHQAFPDSSSVFAASNDLSPGDTLTRSLPH